MSREEIIKNFSFKMLIDEAEVARYDEMTKAVFDELLGNGCIRYAKMQTISMPPIGDVIHGETRQYEVFPYEIKEKYKELF